MERFSSTKPLRSLSDTYSRAGQSGESGELGCLAFHDHHLGKKGSRGLVKSTTVDDCSASGRSLVSSASFTMPQQLSSLLGRRKTTIKSVMSDESMLQSQTDTSVKLKAGSATVGWLSKRGKEHQHL